ncbi:disks large-associated protein 5-like isoform X4 [Anguilla anguilla]|uniref:disks large-associated protein 5-like isoform X4 n=1 Tax=Anguilla anguilla TaxID=7936 RepID=UPI0015A7C147|nr:disks large-associated protein 5-like isoform X4 [Anguilla anguilla]
MASRFAQMSQRDSSVAMLRVKMSRRRSQAQKENRDRAVSRHRGLHLLPELDVLVAGPLEEADNGAPLPAKDKKLSVAVEERKKMLARYKEAKELQKEKERRALEKKGGVFKVGVYKPQPLASLPQAPARTKASLTAVSNKVTWSVKQQHPQKPLAQKENVSAHRKAEPAVKPVKPRVALKPQPAPPAGGCRTAPVERTARAQAAKAAKKPQTAPAPAPGQGKTAPGNAEPLSQATENKPAAAEGGTVEGREVEMQTCTPLSPASPSEGGEEPFQRDAVEDERTPSSFAPQGFVFEPPAGLGLFPPAATDTPSNDALLTPSPSRDDAPAGVVSDPPAAPEHSCPSPTTLPPPNPAAPQSPSNSQEPQHDVPYFRAVMASEAGRLTGLCEQWDPRVEEPSIPEEIRERVRTAVGQARLLIRERFGQFQGLVDDCALGRGEKTTTCTDLQGFWDMVFYQVEDVNRKFSVLKEAESRGWQEEHKPLPRIKRTAKKPPVAAAGSAGGGGGASAAAKSRLAAVKAAMRAKREAEAQRAAESPAGEAPPPPQPPADAQTVVFHGGFFQVESPAKVSGSMRRTSLLRTAPSPCSSPCSPSRVGTPRRCLHPAASRPSPAPGVTYHLFGSLCLTLRPQPSPCSTAPPASPPPTRTQNTEREDCSGTPDADANPAPCPTDPTPCPLSPAASPTPCPADPTPCPVSPAANPTPCPISLAANPAPCLISPAASSASPTPCPGASPPPCPMSPAASPINSTPCPVSPAASSANHAPCLISPAASSASPTPCPGASPPPCPMSPAASPMNSTPCPVSPAISPANHTPCLESFTPCPASPTPCPISPTANPVSPANHALCPVSPAACSVKPAPCLVNPTHACQSDHDYARLDSPPRQLESEAPSQSAPRPQEVNCQSGIGGVHLVPLLTPENVSSQSMLVLEVTDAACGQSELVAEVGGSPPALLVALSPSQQVEAVEDLCEFTSPCQRSAYSPSQWQGLDFTLSPSAYPYTPTRGLLLSPDDSSPMGQSPPFTPRPLPLTLGSETPGCVTDRSPQAAARVQMGPAAETSDTADVPGLDFDSCVQPGLRCGPSPRATVAMVTGSSPDSTAVSDGQMESPGGGRADELAGGVRADAV